MIENENIIWIGKAQGSKSGLKYDPDSGSKERGYGLICDTYELGITAMAKIIINPHTGKPFGTVSIAGPSVRMNAQRVEELTPELLKTADKIGEMIYLAQR